MKSKALVLLICLSFSSNIYSQILLDWTVRQEVKSDLKHNIWHPNTNFDTLKTGDTIYFQSVKCVQKWGVSDSPIIDTIN
ncbi:MAG: hypothetical protein ACHQII_05320, partial [Bacteroidia bacterium]